MGGGEFNSNIIIQTARHAFQNNKKICKTIPVFALEMVFKCPRAELARKKISCLKLGISTETMKFREISSDLC